MKTCNRCKHTKSLSDFNKSKTGKYGVGGQCKSCMRDYYLANKERSRIANKQYRDKHKESLNEYNRNYYQNNKKVFFDTNKNNARNNWEHYLFLQVRSRARRTNIEFNITINDIVIPDRCPYMGIPLTKELGQGQLLTNASLDRIDNTKGYIKNNVQVISRLANTMKSNSTKEQLIIFAKNILKIHPINKGEQL